MADFGLSETIGSSRQYYRQDEGVIVKLPIKWLAPESINESVFSEKTDIVSYLSDLVWHLEEQFLTNLNAQAFLD